MTNRPITAGVTPLGPSPDYVKLLKGKITSKEYVEKVKREADVPVRPERRAATG